MLCGAGKYLQERKKAIRTRDAVMVVGGGVISVQAAHIGEP